MLSSQDLHIPLQFANLLLQHPYTSVRFALTVKIGDEVLFLEVRISIVFVRDLESECIAFRSQRGDFSQERRFLGLEAVALAPEGR